MTQAGRKTATVVMLALLLMAGVATAATPADATVPYPDNDNTAPMPTPPTDDSMWVKIDSIHSQTSYQGIFISGDTVFCSNQSNAVHLRSRLTGDTIRTWATRSGSSVISICRFGDSLCISRLSSPEMCEVYTLNGTYVRQFSPSGGQQVRGLDWDGTKFWASSYSSSLTIYTMNTAGTVLKTLSRSGGNQVPISIGRDLTLDRMYANHLWSAPNTSTPYKVMYVSFDTTANTYTVQDTFQTGLAGYMSGIEFYTDPIIGGCIYVNTFSNSGWMWRFKVHDPMGAPGDVGCTRVIGPSGSIPYGVPVIPQAKVKNYSTVAQTFPVRFDIGGTTYSSTKTVTNLAAGDSVTVNFDSWNADVAGAHALKCSTQLYLDTIRSNDKATGACFVPLVDAGTRSIVAPTGTIPWGTPVTPRALVKNFGTAVIPSFTAKFTIGTSYRDSATISSLAAGDSVIVNFRNWAVDTIGTLVTRCSTRLTGDQIPGDDTASGSVLVQLTDVCVEQIYAPVGSGMIDSGTVVAPRCTVGNRGTTTVTFDVDMRIGSGYTATATVTNMPPGRRPVGFTPNWTATGRGWVPMSCSTKLSGDMIPADDRKRDSVFIRVRDAGAVRITSPVGAILPGPVIPSADVHNWGNVREACKVFFRINSSPAYRDSVVLPNGLPYADTNLHFTSWTAVGGAYRARCSTALTGDAKRANDTTSAAFVVGTIDVGVTAILAPTGSFDTAILQIPKAKAKNAGTAPATGVKAIFNIDSTPGNSVYLDSLTVDIGAGVELTLTFDTWPKPYRIGPYLTKCWVVAPGDGNPANDSLTGTFVVGSEPPGWYAKTPMPAGGKSIKDGAWLTWDAGTRRIYVSRGNKTPDFFSYNPVNDSWKTLAPWPTGSEGKLPSKSSAGCADGNGTIWATKGNNKSGFYKYDAVANAWTQMKDVPLGVSNKKVKGGTGIAWAFKGGTGYPYLLKGYKNEFYKYDVAADAWVTLPDAPIGTNQKWDKGSWLASDGAHTLYAAKAKYNEFYSYNTELDTWSGPLAGMPTNGSGGNKKQKDGSCGAYTSMGIFAFKGGNTQEFWKCMFTTDGNSWGEKDTIPKGALKKKVKAGAGITAAGTNLYALKGNKTNELWMYVPGADLFEAPRHDGVVASSFIVPRSSFIVSPNPLASGFATLRYSLPKAGAATLRIYDVTGQCVFSQSAICNLQSAMPLDLRSMPAGVYLVKLSIEGFATSQKLVVQR